jgi:hypothetical protein
MAQNVFGRLDNPHVVERIRTQLGLPSPTNQDADAGRSQTRPRAVEQSDNKTIDPMDGPVADDADEPQGGPVAVIEVSNGNGVRWMAREVGDFLKRNGMHVSRLTNDDHFGHAKTVIYYREGYYDAAWQVHRLLPGLSEAGHLAAARLDREPIRVLIGRDLAAFYDTLVRDVDVEITNGNGVDGMAGRLGRRLRREGFRVGRLTNANHFEYQTTVLFYGTGKADQAMSIADVLPGKGRVRMIALDQAGMHVQILIGADMVF